MSPYLYIPIAFVGFWIWRRIFKLIADKLWLNTSSVHSQMYSAKTLASAMVAKAHRQGAKRRGIELADDGDNSHGLIVRGCRKLGILASFVTGFGIIAGLILAAGAAQYLNQPMWAYIVFAVLAGLGRAAGGVMDIGGLEEGFSDRTNSDDIRAVCAAFIHAAKANWIVDLMVFVAAAVATCIWLYSSG